MTAVRALRALLPALVVWWLIARLSFVSSGGEWWMPSVAIAWSIVFFGVHPWLYGLLAVQILGALPWQRASWASSTKTRDVALNLAAGAALAWFACLVVFSMPLHLRQLSFVGVDRQSLTMPRLAVALGVGSVSCGLIALFLRRFGALPGLSILMFVEVVADLVEKRQNWAAALDAFVELRSLNLLAVLFPMALSLWLWRGAYEVPADEGDVDARPIRLPWLAAGAMPFFLMHLAMALPSWTAMVLVRLRLAASNAPLRVQATLETWHVPLTIALLCIGTVLALRILYPPARLRAIYGPDAERVRRWMHGWPSPYLVKIIAAMMALEASWWVAVLLGLDLGLTSGDAPLTLAVGLAGIASALVERGRLERSHGELVPVACVLGALSAGACRDRLARAGIPSAAEAWVVHEVTPITVPGGGEVIIKVPAPLVEEAVRILKEHLETTADAGAELIV